MRKAPHLHLVNIGCGVAIPSIYLHGTSDESGTYDFNNAIVKVDSKKGTLLFIIVSSLVLNCDLSNTEVLSWNLKPSKVSV